MSTLTAAQLVSIRTMKARLYKDRVSVYRVPAAVGGIQGSGPVAVATGVKCNLFPGGTAAAGGTVSLGLAGENNYAAFVAYGTAIEDGDELRATSGLYTGQTFNVQSVARWEIETVCQCVLEAT
jgi:hypothetical protein